MCVFGPQESRLRIRLETAMRAGLQRRTDNDGRVLRRRLGRATGESDLVAGHSRRGAFARGADDDHEFHSALPVSCVSNKDRMPQDGRAGKQPDCIAVHVRLRGNRQYRPRRAREALPLALPEQREQPDRDDQQEGCDDRGKNLLTLGPVGKLPRKDAPQRLAEQEGDDGENDQDMGQGGSSNRSRRGGCTAFIGNTLVGSREAGQCGGRLATSLGNHPGKTQAAGRGWA